MEKSEYVAITPLSFIELLISQNSKQKESSLRLDRLDSAKDFYNYCGPHLRYWTLEEIGDIFNNSILAPDYKVRHPKNRTIYRVMLWSVCSRDEIEDEQIVHIS
ncbi:hypothetical protein ACTFIR_007599 [Dictyostelium discoideum]